MAQAEVYVSPVHTSAASGSLLLPLVSFQCVATHSVLNHVSKAVVHE